jgi:dTMP kinase
MNPKNKAKFIVIEGPDRCGKATQTKLLSQSLRQQGFRVATLEVPLKSNSVYHLIYWMLGNGLAKKLPKAFQWLQYFNRQIFQWFLLPSLETKHDYIIMDRWSLSTVVYGEATGVSKKFTEVLYRRLRDPDFVFILSGTPHKHIAEDVYEADAELQKNVRKIYSDWAEANPKKSILIDCTKPREEISKKMQVVLEEAGLLEE